MSTKLSDFLGYTVNVPDTFPTDVTFASGVKETKETLSGTSVNLDPSTGTIKIHTLTGNTTYTESLLSGEYVTLVIAGAGYTVTWPTMVWTNNGGAAPDLTMNDFTFVTIWKVGSVLYGSLIGSSSYVPPTNVNTTLLLHTDDATSASDFRDSSVNNLSLTRLDADVEVSTAQFKYGVSSAYFSTDTTAILLPTSSLLTLDGDFTIESWCYKNDVSDRVLVGNAYVFGGANQQIQFDQGNNAGRFGIYHQNTGWLTVEGGSSPINTWFHVAVTRQGSTLRFYLDGVYKGTQTSSETYDFSGGAIGALRDYFLGGWVGYLDDFRIQKGQALYTTTSSFTPPSAIGT